MRFGPPQTHIYVDDNSQAFLRFDNEIGEFGRNGTRHTSASAVCGAYPGRSDVWHMDPRRSIRRLLRSA